MSLDRVKKFVATADGTAIRLFPENYSVLIRPAEITEWQLRLDPAIGIDLAVEIFKAYHTQHSVRWGDKSVPLKALNALLKEEADVEHYDTDWELDEVLGGYHIWVRYRDGKELFQCTITQSPPQTNAGYENRAALLKLKGIAA